MSLNGFRDYLGGRSSSTFRKVYIKNLVTIHSNSQAKMVINAKPKLFVDGMSVVQRLYQIDNSEWVYGGQWKKYVENIKVFVDRFNEEGVELVFFFDGSTETKNTEDWISQGTENMKSIRKIFQHIVQFQTHPDASMNQIPASLGVLFRYALKYVCKCTVVNSFVDVHREIAKFALEDDSCFAILSENSDYMLFDTKPYLSVAHLKLGPLETIFYDRCSFADSLNLKEPQLPLFSCLLGNDFVTGESLYPFHCLLTQSTSYTNIEIVTKVAEYIITNNWQWVIYNDEIVYLIAGKIGLSGENLLKGMKYYSDFKECGVRPTAVPEVIRRDLLDRLKAKHRECELNPHLLTIASHKEFTLNECLEDQRVTGLMPSAFIYREMRQRMYAIIFKEQDEVEELVFIQDIAPGAEKVKPVEFVVFGTRQPDLQTLWKYQYNAGLHWRTFITALNVTFVEDRLKGLKRHWVAFACLVNFLLVNPVGEPRLFVWEVDAMIAQVVSPLSEDPEEISALKVPYVEARAVHLATIILQGLTSVLDLNQVCKSILPTEMVMPWKCFDGKLFHFMYIMAKHGATMEVLMQNDPKCIREFIQLRSICVAGTYIIKERYQNQGEEGTDKAS